MSGTFTSGTLNEGYMSNTSIITLYQAPASNVGYVKNFVVTNSINVPQQITLFKNLNGNVYQWAIFTLNPGEWADILENETVTLTAGDSIQANTNVTSTNAAAYTLHGVQEK